EGVVDLAREVLRGAAFLEPGLEHADDVCGAAVFALDGLSEPARQVLLKRHDPDALVALARGQGRGARLDAEAEDDHRDTGDYGDDAEPRNVADDAHHWMRQEIDAADDVDAPEERAAAADAALEAGDGDGDA